ncbi:MAG: hypothetical protein HUU15_10245, partial [Candidatus Brocadiae bacterium]|nr:hypothetical protein [Candidatus Brocadiia bacterium]
FAGQFHTELGVRDEAALRAALREVMASQLRTTAYGGRAGAAAAVVQEMIEPECAGVAFLRDPATGSGILIESVEGRGDALVSGRAAPLRLRILGEERTGSTHLSPALERDLAARVAAVSRQLGAAQDIEWAVAGGRLWLLQTRPQTPTAATLVADLRASTRRRTAWSALYSLAETCPAPTPMTWEFLQALTSWEGGYGRAFRRLGLFFRADVRREGFLRLVGARLYADLDREAGTYFGEWPLAHDLEALRTSPAAASRPEPRPDWTRASLRLWLTLPWYIWKLLAAQRTIDRALVTFPAEYARFETGERTWWAAAAPASTGAEIAARFERAAGRVGEFAVAASVLAATVFERTPVARRRELRPWIGADLAHRGPREMELAAPRWRELPAEFERLRASAPPPREGDGVYALRERGKDLLLRAVDVLRRDLLLAGERTGLGSDVFFATLGELDRPDPAAAAARRSAREALLRIPLPPLIFHEDAPAPAAAHAGTGLAPGTAQGTALLPDSIAACSPAADAVLVLPDLDPAWTLLFTRVRAVVTERGGMLSHGAIVARELGVPCVCVPDARARFREGMRLRVDGDAGTAEPA